MVSAGPWASLYSRFFSGFRPSNEVLFLLSITDVNFELQITAEKFKVCCQKTDLSKGALTFFWKLFFLNMYLYGCVGLEAQVGACGLDAPQHWDLNQVRIQPASPAVS